MVVEKIQDYYEELKKIDSKVIGLLVTDDSGLLIYSNASASGSEILGGTVVAILKRVGNILKNFGAREIYNVSLRIENYSIIIIPIERTITVVIKKVS